MKICMVSEEKIFLRVWIISGTQSSQKRGGVVSFKASETAYSLTLTSDNMNMIKDKDSKNL